MLVGYMRVSTDSDRQVLDLQRDALVAVGVDERHLFEDRVSGSRGDRAGLAKALAFIKSGDCLVVYAVTVSVQCHQRRMLATENSPVSALMPTLTNPALAETS